MTNTIEGWNRFRWGYPTRKEETSMKAYRVITDEPQGICVGFKPNLFAEISENQVKFDEFELVEYDYPCESELYVFINKDSTKLAITTDDDYGYESTDWPNSFEPDLMIWHTPDEFNEWVKDYETTIKTISY